MSRLGQLLVGEFVRKKATAGWNTSVVGSNPIVPIVIGRGVAQWQSNASDQSLVALAIADIGRLTAQSTSTPTVVGLNPTGIDSVP
jgi:hypothetical protein